MAVKKSKLTKKKIVRGVSRKELGAIPAPKVFKDKTKYTRKLKHKKPNKD
jgi:hypothetical protein